MSERTRRNNGDSEMSASILWQRIDASNSLGVGAPSSVIGALEAQFGSMPITLDAQHHSELMAMSYAAEYKDQKDAYAELAAAASKKPIRVWAEY